MDDEWTVQSKICAGRKDRADYLQKQLPRILPIFGSTSHFSIQEVKSLPQGLALPTNCNGSDMVSVLDLELKVPDSFCSTSLGALSYHIKKPC